MRFTGALKIIFLSLLVLSLVLMWFFVNNVITWISIIAFVVLSLLSVIQLFLISVRGSDFHIFKYFIAIVLLIQSVCFIALLLGFQQIGTWKYFLIVAAVFFVITSLFIIVYLKKFIAPKIRKVFVVNILTPSLIILFLGLFLFTVSEPLIFKGFNRNRDHQSYEQYIGEEQQQNSDQIPTF
ncbi:MAG TPA: hypothetical protein PKW80_16235 [Bacteroidales bacterium]|mgnify:CR=1 FL=1|nr:hypothetical protein [Bacteroidales bacterium]